MTSQERIAALEVKAAEKDVASTRFIQQLQRLTSNNMLSIAAAAVSRIFWWLEAPGNWIIEEDRALRWHVSKTSSQVPTSRVQLTPNQQHALSNIDQTTIPLVEDRRHAQAHSSNLFVFAFPQRFNSRRSALLVRLPGQDDVEKEEQDDSRGETETTGVQRLSSSRALSAKKTMSPPGHRTKKPFHLFGRI